jgi:hypothetical protein
MQGLDEAAFDKFFRYNYETLLGERALAHGA